MTRLRNPPHSTSGTSFADCLDLPEWMNKGLCSQGDPEAWFPEPGCATSPAKQICARCPVVAECLAYALEHDERHGVWGGRTPTERKLLRGAA